jgi:hypothetical protein
MSKVDKDKIKKLFKLQNFKFTRLGKKFGFIETISKKELFLGKENLVLGNHT